MLWVNVPIGIAAAAIAPSLIAETRAEGEVRHFDVAGAVTITLGLSALVFALLDAETAGWGSAQTIGTLVASALLLVAFVAIERRSRAPLVPFSIFRIRTITGANVVGILVGASLFSMFFFISLYMQQVLGYSPIKAGLSYLPLAVSIILSAGIASQLVTKVGFKPILADRDGADRRSGCSGSPRSRSTAASSPTSSAPRCSPRSGSASPSCRSRSPPSPGSKTASRAWPAA